MAITTAMCSSFKTELLGGLHDLDTDSLKLALIKASPSGTYGVATTNYSNVTGASDEASGTNYSAGGQALGSPSIAVTTSASGCIIYNTANSNSAICVIDFGGTVSATAGDLTIQFPTADASNAVIRIA